MYVMQDRINGYYRGWYPAGCAGLVSRPKAMEETGITIAVGDSVYLSGSHSGTVTNLIPGPYSQYIGVCTALGSVADTVDIWFMPNAREENSYSPNWFDQYQSLLLNSVYKRMTVDTFVNLDRVDPSYTALINLTYKRIDGEAAEFLLTTDLVEAGYNPDGTATVIVSCQVSADDSGDIDWYVSNNGGLDGWEGPIDLNVVHDFATVLLSLSSTAFFEVGEIVTETETGKTGIINGVNNGDLLLRNVIMASEFTIGNTITSPLGGNGTIEDAEAPHGVNQITRTTDDYQDIRIRAVFGGTGYINDYALLYDEDETILDTTPENEYNIETLFHDVYTNPSIDDDGDPNLTVPLQTKIDGYLHTEDGTANTIWEVTHNLEILDKIACVVCTDLSYNLVTPSTIYFDTTNTLTITHVGPQTGYAKVRG